MSKRLHATLPLCVVHQMEAPQIIVDLDNVVIATSEVGDHIVQQAVHFASFCLHISTGIGKNLLDSINGRVLFVKHRPRESGTLRVKGEGEGVAADSRSHFVEGHIFQWT